MIHFISSITRVFKYETFKIGIAMVALWIFSVGSMSIFESWNIWKTTWWFIVTITTVGYGDISPATVSGQVSACFVIFFGIGIGAVLIGNIISKLVAFRRKKMKGLGNYNHFKNHVVIMGWRGAETEHIIKRIHLDKNHRDVLLCSETLEELPENLDICFVKGILSSEDVLFRAGVHTAGKIIIYGKDDQETILTTLAVISSDDEDKSDITVLIKDEDNVQHINRLSDFHGNSISIIKSLDTDLIVQEMQDKGIADIFETLLDNGSDATPYRLNFDDPVYYNDALVPDHALKFACVSLGKIRINPQENPLIEAIFYISNERHV